MLLAACLLLACLLLLPYCCSHTPCLNMQPIGVPSCSPPLTPFYGFYVYFGLGINVIWLCVPMGMLYVNVRRDFGVKSL